MLYKVYFCRFFIGTTVLVILLRETTRLSSVDTAPDIRLQKTLYPTGCPWKFSVLMGFHDTLSSVELIAVTCKPPGLSDGTAKTQQLFYASETPNCWGLETVSDWWPIKMV